MPRKSVVEYIYLEDNFDSTRTINEWIALFNRIKEEYGGDAQFLLDSGYNNTSGVVVRGVKKERSQDA